MKINSNVDLALMYRSSPDTYLVVAFGNGANAFATRSTPPYYTISGISSGRSVNAADINGDTSPDVVLNLGNGGSAEVGVGISSGSGWTGDFLGIQSSP